MPEHFRCRDGSALGHLQFFTGHGAGAVQHDGDGGALFLFFVRRFESHGQHFFNGRAIVTTDTEGTRAAEHDEAAAEFIDVIAQQVHERLAKLMRRNVG